MDHYFTIKKREEALLKIEGSKFIAEAVPVYTRDEAEDYLRSVRKKYFDATHHCYAYAIGEQRAVFQYSDDGEPSGTAGVKIYSAIQAGAMSDLLVVVTRYFGGVKLGVGGLGRAYHDAASDVLKKAEKLVRMPVVLVTATVSYPFVTPLMNLCARAQTVIADAHYAEQVTFTLHVPAGREADIERQIVELTNGTALVARGERLIRSAG